VGFKGNLQRAVEIGTTTKTGHLGMGLAIADQALSSMAGKLILVPNQRGVRFEIRWPKSKA
jgi:sensor histidine kinase regulating citrate/malate metabolism